MYSCAALYANSRQEWRVVHDAQLSLRDLQLEGNVPPTFPQLAASLAAQQDAEGSDDADADVDYFFEAPIDLAHLLPGYRHDQMVDTDEAAPFEFLARAPTEPSGRWWQRW